MMITSSPSIPIPPFRFEANRSLFSTWASKRSHSTTSEDVLPLSVPVTTRLASFAASRLIQSDCGKFDLDHSSQSLNRPYLSNRDSTYSGQVGKQCNLGPEYLATDSMTDTATRWSNLMKKSLYEGTEHRKKQQNDTNRHRSGSVGNTVVEASQSDRRWGYSGRLFTISVGCQRSPIGKSLKTETTIRTYTSANSGTNIAAFKLPTDSYTASEQTEQECPVNRFEQSLIPQWHHGVRKEKRFQKLGPKSLLHCTKQKLRFRSLNKVTPSAQGKTVISNLYLS